MIPFAGAFLGVLSLKSVLLGVLSHPRNLFCLPGQKRFLGLLFLLALRDSIWYNQLDKSQFVEEKVMKMDRNDITALFEKYIKKLRITPSWDIRLELIEDLTWPKTGDFKIDCDDRKAILLINILNPTQENLEEVIVHELMHIKMYPLDQVTESLITNCFEEGSAASNFAYQQFFTTLEQTVEELAKCFLLEFGDNKEFSYGRCKKAKSFNELYDSLNNIE